MKKWLREGIVALVLSVILFLGVLWVEPYSEPFTQSSITHLADGGVRMSIGCGIRQYPMWPWGFLAASPLLLWAGKEMALGISRRRLGFSGES